MDTASLLHPLSVPMAHSIQPSSLLASLLICPGPLGLVCTGLPIPVPTTAPSVHTGPAVPWWPMLAGLALPLSTPALPKSPPSSVALPCTQRRPQALKVGRRA